MDLNVQDSIARPVAEVYETIVSAEGLCKFFTSRASAPLTEGAVVTWSFGHADAEFQVKVGALVPNRSIAWTWPADGGDTVTIELRPDGPDATLVEITESAARPLSLDSAAWAVGQTQGWTYFVTTLRAYLVHGIEHFGLSDRIQATVTASPGG